MRPTDHARRPIAQRCTRSTASCTPCRACRAGSSRRSSTTSTTRATWACLDRFSHSGTVSAALTQRFTDRSHARRRDHRFSCMFRTEISAATPNHRMLSSWLCVCSRSPPRFPRTIRKTNSERASELRRPPHALPQPPTYPPTHTSTSREPSTKPPS